MAKGSSSRHREAPTARAGVSHDWEKDEEELGLEEKLFGIGRVRDARRGNGSVEDEEEGSEEDEESGGGMSGVEDEQVCPHLNQEACSPCPVGSYPWTARRTGGLIVSPVSLVVGSSA